MIARRILLPISIATFLAASATSQSTTFDDFSGKVIDKTRWFVGGDTSKATQANGLLRLFGRGHYNDVFLFALDGLDRTKSDIEIAVTFSGFRAGGQNGGFELFAFDAELKDPLERDISVGMGFFWDSSTSKWVTGFEAELCQTDKNNKETCVSKNVPSTATAGELRIRCSKSNTASVSYRASGQSAWTLLGSVQNFFLSNYVSFGIAVNVDDHKADGADVAIDKITVKATKIPKSVITYGSRCHDLGAVAVSYPHINNTVFGFLAIGGSAFRGDTWLLALGLKQQQPASFPWPGAPGCTLYVTAPLLIVPGSKPLDLYGEAWVTQPIPNITALRGLKVVAQFAATTNRNAARLALSNGIELTIW